MLELDELVISIRYEYEGINFVNQYEKYQIFSVFILILILILNNGITNWD